MRMTCPACDGDLEFDLEGPDYDVGLMGYSAALREPERETDCHCPHTVEEIEKLEWDAAVEYTNNPPEPPGLP